MSKLAGAPFKHTAIGTVVVPFCPVCGLLLLEYLYRTIYCSIQSIYGKRLRRAWEKQKFLTSPVIDLHCSTVACLIRRDYSNVLRAVAHERDMVF